MSNSTHKVEVVPLVREKHPNADLLSVVKVYGYTCVIKNSDWEGVEIAAYVPPDNVLPDRPEYAWLPDKRIKARKFRGILSFGLLVPAPEGSKIGDDVAEQLGITHYEPLITGMATGGEVGKSPSGHHPVYDVDSFRRYGHVFKEGELVHVGEKIHGSNSRYTWIDGEMFCGSRTEWKKYDEGNLWWKALAQHPELREFCEANPGVTVYGEVYGQVQNLKYGTEKGQLRFAAFDILDASGKWINILEARELGKNLPWVPVIENCIPFDAAYIETLCDGQSLIPGANHIREGCVVKPIVERWDIETGRVQLKLVSAAYLNL